MSKPDKKNRKKEAADAAASPVSNNIWIMLLLAAIAFLLYSNSLRNGFVLDDNSAIESNSIVQKGIKAWPELLNTEYRAGYWTAQGNLYRPLSLMVFAALWDISPNNPYPGHLLNCLLYALTAVLLFRVLNRLWSDRNGFLPFLTTLLFVVHPLHTEVVANIKSLDEILSLLFLLFASWNLLNYRDKGGVRPLILAGLCYFLALMSKESAITFLAVFPLMAYFFFTDAKRPLTGIVVSSLVPALIYLMIRQAVLGSQKGEPYHLLLIDNSLVGAADFMEKTASAFVLLGKYLWMQLYPQPLLADYSVNQIPLVRWNSPSAWLSLVAYLTLAALVMLRFRRKEKWVFGIAVFLITISLYSNLLITIGTNFGERLAYLPSFGACIALVTGLAAVFPKRPAMKAGSFASAFASHKELAVVVLIASLLGARITYARNTDWNSYLSIYEADVRKASESARLNYWYGMEVMKVRGLKATDPVQQKLYYDTALYHLDKALTILPEYGDAYAQRGLLHYRRGEMALAEADYKEAARLKVGQWGMYSNLAIMYGQRMMEESDTAKVRMLFDEAMKNLRYALQVDPRPATIYKNMANLYHNLGMWQDAIFRYKEALEHVTPEYERLVPEINMCLEECYRLSGDSANAQYYRRMLQ
jgi:tetratricopeptide (TPR) repeat protein